MAEKQVLPYRKKISAMVEEDQFYFLSCYMYYWNLFLQRWEHENKNIPYGFTENN